MKKKMMKSRSVALDEGVSYSMNMESIKPAFLRRKHIKDVIKIHKVKLQKVTY